MANSLRGSDYVRGKFSNGKLQNKNYYLKADNFGRKCWNEDSIKIIMDFFISNFIVVRNDLLAVYTTSIAFFLLDSENRLGLHERLYEMFAWLNASLTYFAIHLWWKPWQSNGKEEIEGGSVCVQAYDVAKYIKSDIFNENSCLNERTIR